MPSQLYTNVNIEFICARNFTYAGVDYKLGDEWDQDLHPGDIDKLIRTRYLYAVVDSTAEKPRHWHHHVWVRGDIEKKLGIFRDEDDDSLGGSTLYNKPKQIGLEQPSVKPGAFDEWEETEDNGRALWEKQNEAILAQRVLDDENADDEPGEDEETEPEEIVNPPEVEVEEEDEDEVTEDDLYDPSDYTVDEVNDYLNSDISEDEYNRVLAAERNGKNRKGIVGE